MIALIVLGRLWIPGDSFSFLATRAPFPRIGFLLPCPSLLLSLASFLSSGSLVWDAYGRGDDPDSHGIQATRVILSPFSFSPGPPPPEAGSEDLPGPTTFRNFCSPAQALNAPLLSKSNRVYCHWREQKKLKSLKQLPPGNSHQKDKTGNKQNKETATQGCSQGWCSISEARHGFVNGGGRKRQVA